MTKRVNVVDHPAIIDAASIIAVITHAVLSSTDLIPPVWEPLIRADLSNQTALYLGFFGVAALVSSFAGIVVIFGITPQTPRFQKFRVGAGASLSRQWIWTSGAGFTSAGLGLAAGIAALSGGAWLAPWFLELAILLVAHSAIRLVLILRALVQIVRRDDVDAVKKLNDRPASEAPWNR